MSENSSVANLIAGLTKKYCNAYCNTSQYFFNINLIVILFAINKSTRFVEAFHLLDICAYCLAGFMTAETLFPRSWYRLCGSRILKPCQQLFSIASPLPWACQRNSAASSPLKVSCLWGLRRLFRQCRERYRESAHKVRVFLPKTRGWYHAD